MGNKCNSIAVIIPTKNRLQSLMQTLASIQLQTHQPNEVIIIDQSDKFFDIKKLSKFKEVMFRLKHIYNPTLSGLTAAKNEGIKHTTAEIVFFIEDDIILAEDFIEKVIEIYRWQPYLGGVGGYITNYRKSRLHSFLYRLLFRGQFRDPRYEFYRSSIEKIPSAVETNIISGGCVSFKRIVLEEFKFSEWFTGYSFGEDVEFCLRANSKYKFALTSAAKAIHNKSTQRIKSSQLYFHYRYEVRWYYYWCKRLVRPSLASTANFYLANIGLMLSALLGCLRSRSVAPLRGILNGYFDIILLCRTPELLLRDPNRE